MGVTTIKNINPITIGATIPPKVIPNLNHTLFKGVSNFELSNPSIKKINDNIIDQILISFSLKIGHKPTIRNTTKKTIPKLLFELILILFLFTGDDFIQFI